MSEQALFDQIQIRALLDRYCDGVNQRDEEIWGSTWAADGLWELPHLEVEGIRGREAIVATWIETMKLFPFVNMMAQPGFISVNGDRATMRSYTTEVAVMQDGTEIRPRGEYHDECVRENGEWKFSLRKFRVLHGE
ncbi:MAG: nuclear transport factor 2 family protein [Pseudomonadota bacterium]